MSATQRSTLFLALAVLGACTNTARFGGEPETATAPPPTETPPAAAAAPVSTPTPPIDLAGKWKLTAVGSTCLMTLSANSGAADGKIAPGGGCPGNFFTSRKWSYENDTLSVRDFKGQALAQLPFAKDHFESRDATGNLITLTRP